MAFTGWVQHSPDYTETLTGVYTMTYMNWNGDIARMPEPGFSGSVRMTKRDNTHLDMTFSIKAHGNGKTIDETSDPQTVELRPGHGMSFFLYENRVKLGTISPKAISIKTVTETGAGVVEIKAWR
ncbi:hypothetical protein SAMN06269250_2833 [Spirosoma fluviale]|uniref:Lipocalin-like domain-containing protein n=2 Tax=Spirosoma fluviale TaxID=1597977 RepID=A0A286FZR6_9BACT|nr:hypothetical protein SAMN06269250_2833 [Spirosoma fluviale]